MDEEAHLPPRLMSSPLEQNLKYSVEVKDNCKRRNIISLMLGQDSQVVLEETLLGSFMVELKHERMYL